MPGEEVGASQARCKQRQRQLPLSPLQTSLEHQGTKGLPLYRSIDRHRTRCPASHGDLLGSCRKWPDIGVQSDRKEDILRKDSFQPELVKLVNVRN